MKRVSVFLCLFLICSSVFAASTFGIEMGWTLEDLNREGIPYRFIYTDTFLMKGIDHYKIEPLKTLKGFDEYEFDYVDGYGIISLTAHSSIHSFSTESEFFDRMVNISHTLDSKYGDGRTTSGNTKFPASGFEREWKLLLDPDTYEILFHSITMVVKGERTSLTRKTLSPSAFIQYLSVDFIDAVQAAEKKYKESLAEESDKDVL